MSVGLIIAIGVMLLILFGMLIAVFEVRNRRKIELEKERERTEQKKAEAREKLFEDETIDPIDREL